MFVLFCFWVYDNGVFINVKELIFLSYAIDPDPSSSGEVIVIFELDSSGISALKKVVWLPRTK